MPRPTSPYRTAIFYGASDDVGTEVAEGHASVIRNLYRDRGKLVGRGGSSPHNDRNLAGAGTQIDGLFWARFASDDHLFALFSGSVWECYPNAPPVILSGGSGKLTSGRKVAFAALDARVYAGDGLLPNIRLNATTAAQAALDAPSAGMTAVAIAGGTLSAGVTYRYRVTFLSADAVESDPGAIVTASATSAGNQQISLANIPTAAGTTDCSGRKIYRTTATGTTYQLVTTIADNTTTVYTDNVADASLGADLSSQSRRALPPCQILAAHEGRLLGGASAAAGFDNRTLFISNFEEPSICPAAPDLEDPNQGTEITLSGPAAGEITGIVSHGDRAYVFTWDSCFVLVGDQPLDFSLKLYTRIGCAAHRTLHSVRDRILWLAPDGVYEAREGAGVRRVSDPIRGWLDGLTAAQMAAAHAFIWDDRYYLSVGNDTRYLDLEYSDLTLLQWGEITDWEVNVSTVAYAGQSNRARIFAGKNGTPRVWELETGDDDDGEAIECRYTSPMWDLGNPGREKRIHHVGATFAVGTGTASVTLAKGTAGAIETFTVDLASALESGGAIVRLFQRAKEEARSEYFQVSVTHQKTAPFQLLAVDGLWSLAT